MIEVTGSKTQPRETDPAARYVLKDNDRQSRTPAVLSALVMGLAFYLKSIFPGLARQETGRLADEAEAEGKAEAGMAETAMLDRPVLDEINTATVVRSDLASGSGRPLVELAPEAEFLMVEAPKIEFFQPEIEISWLPLNEPAFNGNAANDNSAGIGTPDSKAPEWDAENPDNGGGGNNGPDDETCNQEPSDCGGGNDGDGDGDGDNDCQQVCTDETPGNNEDGEIEPCDDDRTGQNRAPRITGPVYLLDVTGCAVLAIAMADLLRHAVDPDGDALAIQNLTISSGALTPVADGWIFQSEPQMRGLVTIKYQITDGEFLVSQTASFSVITSSIEGTDGDDLLVGSMCDDEIVGHDGADNIDGRAGNDSISGGNGDDIVFGGNGDDMIFGGAGNDHISGGAGNDRLFGGEGDDIIFGDDGDDHIAGESGNDFLSGGAGDDVLLDGDGEDVVFGDEGNDHVIAALDAANDFYDGGAGCDTLDYSATTQGVTVDLACGSASGVEIGEDTISGFETVRGGSGDDHFIAGDEDMVMSGGGGDDLFEFVPTTPTTAPVIIMHHILDFEAGDRIRMSKYDIFERVFDDLEDRFEQIYGEEIDDDDVAIRYRQDSVDKIDRTVIEADLNNDGIYETTINIQGHRNFIFVEVELA